MPAKLSKSADCNASNRQHCAIFSAIVMFNLAVVHHQSAIRRGIKHRSYYRLLKKSANLFDLAYLMLNNENLSFGTLFILALANNLAQIYKSLGEEERARRYYEHLLSTLVYSTTECPRKDLETYECFWRSATHLILQDRVAGAA